MDTTALETEMENDISDQSNSKKNTLAVFKTIVNVENKYRNKQLHGPFLSFEVVC